jgi:hypothetical protein
MSLTEVIKTPSLMHGRVVANLEKFNAVKEK